MTVSVQDYDPESVFMMAWVVIIEVDDDTTGVALYDNERSARQHADYVGGLVIEAPVFDQYKPS